jgi:hypothetical protein
VADRLPGDAGAVGQHLPDRGQAADDTSVAIFGRWSSALSAAGVPPVRPCQHWSPERVLEELQRLAQQGQFEDSSRIPDRRLAVAARHYFGRPRQALIAAGILGPDEYKRSRTRWPRRRIIEVLQDRHVRGETIRGDANLVGAAKRHFGSLHKALVAAGIATGQPPPRQHWNQQRVVQEMQARHRRGLRLTPAQDSKPTGAARRYFGKWSRALAAAGRAPTWYQEQR